MSWPRKIVNNIVIVCSINGKILIMQHAYFLNFMTYAYIEHKNRITIILRKWRYDLRFFFIWSGIHLPERAHCRNVNCLYFVLTDLNKLIQCNFDVNAIVITTTESTYAYGRDIFSRLRKIIFVCIRIIIFF